jgi:putative inorganic carbon (HCO3(-)) transporter
MGNRPKYFLQVKNNITVISAFILSILFLIISVALVNNGLSVLWLIPPFLVLAFLAFSAIDKFLLLTVFLVPVSIQLRFIIPETTADISLPAELMLAGILLLMIFKIVYSREISKKILVHPVSGISICLLTWYLITSLTSTIPLVSLKSFITRLWFFAGFYILAVEIFNKPEQIKKYFYAYITGMVPVVFYYLFRMWEAGIINQKAAYLAIRPFFNDHTSFGAALSMCIPVLFYLVTRKEETKLLRAVLSIVLMFFIAAFIFSYSRAAWLSLVFAAGASTVIYLRISWKLIFPMLAAGSVIVFMSWTSLIMRLNKNTQDSSDNIKSHIQSMANIRSDASNLERVNRWKSAGRMFREKPFLGWGPSTYQFRYAPFQIASEKTIISTNYGEGGNAHSEYLGALVDSGIPGMILYIILLIGAIWKGILIWKTHTERNMRYLALALVAGLLTYVFHGALNNFLDTDKISALFWGMIAAIVAIDIKMKKENEQINLS